MVSREVLSYGRRRRRLRPMMVVVVGTSMSMSCSCLALPCKLIIILLLTTLVFSRSNCEKFEAGDSLEDNAQAPR